MGSSFPPSKWSAQTSRGGSGKSKAGKETACLPRSYAENLHPGSHSARKTPHSRSASGPSARPICHVGQAEGADAKCLIRVRVLQRGAIQGLGREIEMRPEILRRGWHLGRSPDVAEGQRVAADAPGLPWSVISVGNAARRLLCAGPSLSLL